MPLAAILTPSLRGQSREQVYPHPSRLATLPAEVARITARVPVSRGSEVDCAPFD